MSYFIIHDRFYLDKYIFFPILIFNLLLFNSKIDYMNKKTNSLIAIIFILWTIDAHLIEIENIQPH